MTFGLASNISCLWWILNQKMNYEEANLLRYIVIGQCLRDREWRLWREKTYFGLLIFLIKSKIYFVHSPDFNDYKKNQNYDI